jgi:cytochrome c-type biogenesis protein CcmH
LLAQAERAGAEKPPAAFFATVRGNLAIEPDNTAALYYAGLGAALDGQTGEARRLWGRLLDTLPADSPQRPDIEQQIRDLPPSG